MDEFKKELNARFQETPPAPGDEYRRILARVREKKTWGKILVPALGFALFVVLFVHPKEKPLPPFGDHEELVTYR